MPDAPLKQRSALCVITYHDFCREPYCDCECHFQWASRTEFEQFLWECWRSSDVRRLREMEESGHHEQRKFRFTPLWDMVSMWCCYNGYTSMNLHAVDAHLAVLREVLAHPDWSRQRTQQLITQHLDLSP